MQSESTRQQPPSPSRWPRIGALLYDPFVWVAELAGMRRSRRALLAQASGRILEIGAGTGLNLAHYPEQMHELVLMEPEPAMRERLTRRIRRAGRQATVVDAAAEALPFADGSFDTVVCTLVLCTVSAPDRALGEIRRVLGPGGRLLFIEHVRADDPKVARLQDRMLPINVRVAHGCHCNRPTLDGIRTAGFEVTELEHGTLPHAPRFIRPLIVGVAQAPASAPTSALAPST
jgi:SAM-dependent methyltransferase